MAHKVFRAAAFGVWDCGEVGEVDKLSRNTHPLLWEGSFLPLDLGCGHVTCFGRRMSADLVPAEDLQLGCPLAPLLPSHHGTSFLQAV